MVLQLAAATNSQNTAVQTHAKQELIWNDETRAHVRQTCFPDAPDNAVGTALLWCETLRLNPFLRHVVIMKFWREKKKAYDYVPYISRDGVVAHAQNTGLLESIQVVHGVVHGTGEKWCEAIVYRKDSTKPYRFTAFLDEFKVESNHKWKDMPRHMLAKAAIKHCVNMAIPLSIPVLDDDSAYFAIVMASATGVIEAPPDMAKLPDVVEGQATEAEAVDPAQLSNYFAEDSMPTIVGETVIENQPPSAPVDDPDAIEKARADVQVLGEDALGVAKWKTMKLALIRSVKATAESVDDLNLEELAKLTTTLVAKKLGAGGDRRM